jgi:hypothetical protein
MLWSAVEGLDFPCVSTDDVTAARQAFTHLASLGHQRIGLVAGPQDHMPSRRKLAAFTEHARRGPGVRQPIESMGKAAVALLTNQMENVSVYPEELLFEPELVVRLDRPGTRGPGCRGTGAVSVRQDRAGSVIQDRPVPGYGENRWSIAACLPCAVNRTTVGLACRPFQVYRSGQSL